MAAIPPGWSEMVTDMRQQADAVHLGRTGFYVINTRSRGAVPVWLEDIRKCATDEQVVDLIYEYIFEQ